MAMSLKEAIAHAKSVANKPCGQCAAEHAQLASWLEDLQELYATMTPHTIAGRENLLKRAQRDVMYAEKHVEKARNLTAAGKHSAAACELLSAVRVLTTTIQYALNPPTKPKPRPQPKLRILVPEHPNASSRRRSRTPTHTDPGWDNIIRALEED